MKCTCGKETKVTDSRPNQFGIRRRRECKKCNVRFSTMEMTIEHTLLTEVQKTILRFNGEMVALLKKAEMIEKIGQGDYPQFAKVPPEKLL